MIKPRTDLALEACASDIGSDNDPKVSGVRSEKIEKKGISVTRIAIETQSAAERLGREIGSYVTVEIPDIHRNMADLFERASSVAAKEIKNMLSSSDGSVLVAGLGNERITPDALGPKTVENIVVTRHAKKAMPDEFKSMRSVCAISPGVLGITGLETLDIIKGVCREIRPSLVILVDALAARELKRLCTTIQISNRGIRPGSGVGNSRAEISERTIGVPVMSIGVPTVVDALTLALDVVSGAQDRISNKNKEYGRSMIVTPKDIDKYVTSIAKVTSFSINKALFWGLTSDEISAFLS